MPDPITTLRRRIAGEVVAIFNDKARGEAPVQRRPAESWFGPQSVTWAVHGDVASMMVGGVSGLMLQMLHPKVLAGVWDHSNFRADMHGRLRRTARFIAMTTYGARTDAEAAIARVRAIHHKVDGTLPNGEPYAADDPRLLAWVHVTETTSFLAAYRRYVRPGLSAADQDLYFAEMARVARALGADPVPETKTAAEALIQSMRPELRVDARTREVARLVLDQRPPNLAARGPQALLMEAGVDLLPAWAQAMHGRGGTIRAPLVRAGTLGVARTLRWAFG